MLTRYRCPILKDHGIFHISVPFTAIIHACISSKVDDILSAPFSKLENREKNLRIIIYQDENKDGTLYSCPHKFRKNMSPPYHYYKDPPHHKQENYF